MRARRSGRAAGSAGGCRRGQPDATQEQQAAQQQDGQQWRGDRQAMAAPQMEREGFQQAEAAEITADNLLGANVYDINDDNIGSVSDIVMGADGAAEYAVIDVGGFLGFGTHTVAIGFDEMQVLHDDGWADLRVYVDVTQEELENMPEYEATN
jgi:sporulation protein YlmC with PRC-barrel domain